MKFFLIICGVLALAWFASQPKNSSVASPASAYRGKADQAADVAAWFDSNEIAANARFQNPSAITGKIAHIQSSFSGDPILTLKTGNTASSLQLGLDDSARNAVIAMLPGQTVTASCQNGLKVLGVVAFAKCVLR